MVRLALSGLALAAISLLVIVIHRPVQSESRREATYAVLPLLERTPGVSQLMSGEEAQLMLYDALARWRDIRLVSMLRLNDLELRSGGHPRTLGEALETARAADATLLVWGQLVRFGDSLQIRAGLYDVVGREEPAREYVVTSSANLSELRAKVDGLAQSLLLGHVGSPSPEDGTGGTRSLAAWKAYDRGHAALDNWDLGAAENEFYLATRLDPEYPQANLWLAQVMSWAGTRQDRPDLWRTAAARASARRVRLNVDDQIRADALHALAEERFPEACADYSRLLARDSAAFAGWYGIGECNRSDPIVVRDARSPSGWTFRGSYHTAVQAYQRALELFPSAHLAFRGNAFHRLQHLLSTEPNVYRAGVTASRDGPRFGAFPSLIDDTLAYVPYPLEAIIAGRPGTNPPTLAAAVARNRTVLKRIALSWTRAFPSSADAHEVLGYALESSGTIGGVHGGAPSALEELSRARGLATERLQQLRLASAEVRLLVKNSDFANAQALADSILRSHPGAVEADTVELLTGLAALTGQPHRLVELLRTFRNDYTARLPDGRPVEVPPRLAETALTLIGYAAMGAPVDSIRSAKMRIEQLLPAHVPATELQSVRAALLERPLGLAFPVLGPAAVEGFTPVTGSLMEAEQALVRKDGSSVRAWFAARQRVRRSRLPGSTSIDAVLQEAWLLLALSDTSTAVRHLDASLGALPTLSTDLLDDVAEAAAVARAMALRAELAHRQGDDATSHRWAAAVVTLWAGADEVLQPVVRRMQGILSEEGSTAGSTLLN
jgi:tetratricopeptide (TPR) repeat protein